MISSVFLGTLGLVGGTSKAVRKNFSGGCMGMLFFFNGFILEISKISPTPKVFFAIEKKI